MTTGVRPFPASYGIAARADRAVARLLRVQPLPPASAQAEPEGSWPFETPLRVSAARCILRYVLLPLTLPLAGLATGAALGVLLLLDMVAVITIVTTLRRLWQTGHSRRWLYLLLATGLMTFVGVFFLSDASAL